MLTSRFRRFLARALAPDPAMRPDQVASELSALRNALSAVQSCPCEASRYTYLGGNVGIVRLASGDKLFVDTRDRSMTPFLIENGQWESHVSNIIREILQPEMTAIDVGTNFGVHMLIASRCVGANGRVIALEPNPQFTRLLRDTLEINGINNVELHQCAALDHEKTIEIMVPSGHMGGGAIALPSWNEDPYFQHHDRYKAPAKRLDDMVPVGQSIGLIRIDADGTDIAVLMGASRILENLPHIAVIAEWGQYNMRYYFDVNEGVSYFVNLGFAFWRICRDGGLTSMRADQMKELALRADQMKGLEICDVLIARPASLPEVLKLKLN